MRHIQFGGGGGRGGVGWGGGYCVKPDGKERQRGNDGAEEGRWWWLELQTLRPRLQDERVAPQTAGPENPPVYCGAADGARRCSVRLVPASKLSRSGAPPRPPPQITVTRKRFASVLRANKENSPRRSECAAVGACLGRIMNNRSCFCFNFKGNFHSLVRRAAFGFDAALKNELRLRSSSRPDYFLLALRNWDGASSLDVLRRSLQKKQKAHKLK